jgi:DNA-binding transcriptional LysR family regulator
VFETAARLKNFRKAADELNITASAVSHAIQNLEDWIGTPLFRREGRGLELTEAGASYFPVIGRALQSMAEATSRLPGRRARGHLSISSAPGFAALWLLPRIREYLAQNPALTLNVQTSHHHVDLPLEGVDVAIRMAPTADAGRGWTHLVEESIAPVCSPMFRQKLDEIGGLEALPPEQLIHVTSVSVDWADWFRTTRPERADIVDSGLKVDTLQLAMQAAEDGLGVTLGRTPVVDSHLAAGKLVQADARAIPSGLSYWLVALDPDFQSQEVKTFRDWLLGRMAARIASLDSHRPPALDQRPP